MQTKFVNICKANDGLHFYEVESKDYSRPGLYIQPVGVGERAKIYIASDKVKELLLEEKEGIKEKFFSQFEEDNVQKYVFKVIE